ncbi:hypothetical protein BRW65_27760 [Mycobacterium paraffinicum]|uniref:Uncharacterized protein n=1 Tax=Mycobacterium paraffinicum TaxID=53378 RepID=A0A1Q4HE61_9MYCO|nr:hypothetical protein BRW65_27760 [Mycobacterium paraffinicum]
MIAPAFGGRSIFETGRRQARTMTEFGCTAASLSVLSVKNQLAKPVGVVTVHDSDPIPLWSDSLT